LSVHIRSLWATGTSTGIRSHCQFNVMITLKNAFRLHNLHSQQNLNTLCSKTINALH